MCTIVWYLLLIPQPLGINQILHGHGITYSYIYAYILEVLEDDDPGVVAPTQKYMDKLICRQYKYISIIYYCYEIIGIQYYCVKISIYN